MTKICLPYMFQLSIFRKAATVLPLIPQISRFEMILTWISDVYEFFFDHAFYKLDVKILAITNNIRYMDFSWPLSLSWAVDPCQQKLFLWLVLAKEVPVTTLRISTLFLKPWEVLLNRPLSKFVLLSQVDIKKSSCENNAKFNFLGIILESKSSWRVYFSGFQRA